MMQTHKVYILCNFSNETSDNITPHDVMKVYSNKEILVKHNPNLDVEWFTPRTSQGCCGRAHSKDGQFHYFILVRHFISDSETLSAMDKGGLWDEMEAEWSAT